MHALCYTYVRATMGASYAPPAYYTDLLAERGRCYIKRFLDGTPELRGQSKEVVRAAIERKWNLRVGTGRTNPWHPNLDLAMFWM